MSEIKEDPTILKDLQQFVKETHILENLFNRPPTDLSAIESQAPLPPEGPSWIRRLQELREENPKTFQVIMMINDLKGRVESGVSFMPDESPEKWVDEAKELNPEDYMRNFKLRQAATEYLLKAAEGNNEAEGRAKKLIKEILGGDELLTEDFYPKLIGAIKAWK